MNYRSYPAHVSTLPDPLSVSTLWIFAALNFALTVPLLYSPFSIVERDCSVSRANRTLLDGETPAAGGCQGVPSLHSITPSDTSIQVLLPQMLASKLICCRSLTQFACCAFFLICERKARAVTAI